MARPKKVAEAVTATENNVTATSVEDTTTTTEEVTAKKTTKRTKKTKEAKEPYKAEYTVKQWFVLPLLGSQPGDKDLFKSYIASRAPDAPTREDELTNATVEEVAARGVNVFLRRTKTGKPCVGQHTIRGFFKEAMTAARRQEGNISEDLKAHKSKITSNVAISPVYIELQFPEEVVGLKTEAEFNESGFGNYGVIKFPAEGRFVKHMMPTLDRPLQAETPKGKITSIASSEMAPAGTSIEYNMEIDSKDLPDGIFDVLKRGFKHGTGQWRGSGEYGNFVMEVRDKDGNIVCENTKEIIGATSDDPDFMEKFWDFVDEINL